jgi:hypothetical protein
MTTYYIRSFGPNDAHIPVGKPDHLLTATAEYIEASLKSDDTKVEVMNMNAYDPNFPFAECWVEDQSNPADTILYVRIRIKNYATGQRGLKLTNAQKSITVETAANVYFNIG